MQFFIPFYRFIALRQKHFKIGCQLLTTAAYNTAKTAMSHKKLIILGDGLAKQSEQQQGKFQLGSLLVPLTSNIPAVPV